MSTVSAPAKASPVTRRMLADPTLPMLQRMAWPNVLVMVVQSAAGLIETCFVGRLGTSALAGVSLVFPMTILMTMMLAGALGGGISSSIARALGARDPEAAERCAFHAIAVPRRVSSPDRRGGRRCRGHPGVRCDTQ